MAKNLTRLIVLLVLASIPIGVVAQSNRSTSAFEVVGPRPLHSVIKELEKRSGIMISYEDPPFWSATESLDVTSGKRLSDPQAKVFAPRNDNWRGRLPDTFRTKDDLRLTLQEILAEYNRSHPGTVFELRSEDDAFAVFPTTVLSRGGSPVTFESPLSAPVSLPGVSQQASRAIGSLLKTVGTKPGRRDVLDAIAHPNPLDRLNLSESINAPSVRSAITRIVLRSVAPQSWQMLCDPAPNGACYVSLTPRGWWQ